MVYLLIVNNGVIIRVYKKESEAIMAGKYLTEGTKHGRYVVEKRNIL